MAAKANHLTENLIGNVATSKTVRNSRTFNSASIMAQKRQSSNVTSNSKLLGQDSGFNNVDMSDRVMISKKRFNANSQSDLMEGIKSNYPTMKSAHSQVNKAKHQDRRKSYNLISGAPIQDGYIGHSESFARKTLLPPQKRYDSISMPKKEYVQNL